MSEPFSPIAEARRIAGEDADAMLPCPVCAASLKAANLDSHVAKVHPGQDVAVAEFSGSDHAIARVLIGIFVAAVLSIGLVPLVPESLDRVFLGGIGLLMTVFLVLLAAMVFDKLPATVRIEEGRVVVRYAFGLLTRSVTFPPRTIEVGTLWETRSAFGVANRYDYGGTDVKTGTYLRLRDDRGGAVTVGAKTGTKLRKHWQGWTQGPKRKMWDIRVPPSALVAIEYLLASRGLLTVRAPD